MKISNFFHKVVSLFEGKKYSEKDYSIDIKNIDISFFDMPRAASFVIKRYGWIIFLHKYINYVGYRFERYLNEIKIFCKKTVSLLRDEGFGEVMARIFKSIFYGESIFPKDISESVNYEKCIEKSEKFDVTKIKKEIKEFKYQPKISIITPVYNIDAKWLDLCIQSVVNQFYENWELCLYDDASTKKETLVCLKKWENKDARIKISYGKENKNISGASNEALKLATGEFIALLDNDDELTPNALFEIVCALNHNQEIDILYSDEDKIINDGKERVCPFFKPDWSPEFFRGVMYVGHFLVIRKSLAFEAGLFNDKFNKVQDYEFMLRLSERTSKIAHIPKVLYHWRIIPGSIASDSQAKGDVDILQEKAVNEHLKRIDLNGLAKNEGTPHRLRIYPLDEANYPLVSIIIPTKDNGEVLDKCLKSLFEKTNYPNYEVILIDNNTKEKKAFEVMKKYEVRIIKYDRKFNFSEINNVGAGQSRGDYLILLNNDTEIIDKDWIKKMLYYAKQKDVGAVGPMLIYPDNKVQHAGVVLGFRGTADHIMRGFPDNVDGYFGSLCCAREVSAVTAACIMIKKSVFEEVGGFNQHYQVIYQDVDLCLKIRNKNYRIIYTPRVKLIHYESKSRGSDYNYLDRLLLLDLWEDKIKKGDPYYNINFDLKKYSANETGYNL